MKNNFRNTIANINLKNISHNISIVKKITDNNKILMAVKADGYGHGAIDVSKYLQKNSLVDFLGVSSIEEGIDLRENDITLPILILGLVFEDDKSLDHILKYNLIPSIGTESIIENLNNLSKKHNKVHPVHLKIDTGMGRVGCCIDCAISLAKKIHLSSNLLLQGIFTHMPVSDDLDNEFNDYQIKTFTSIIEDLKTENINPEYIHMANSAAIINYNKSHFNMVRPGIMCYGYLPDKSCGNNLNLKPSLSLKSQIIYTKHVKAGTSLSYGHIYTTNKDTWISTIPIGYGDGINRHLSNNGIVIIGGKKYPIAGRICMDQILIDTGNESYETGTEVFLLDEENYTVNDMAEYLNTISYEIVCNISKRVPRTYDK